MPNKFTARHEPPIESALVRTIFFGGHEDELRLWKVMDQFSDTGALPSASYGLLMIGVNAMVYHHSSSEDDQGRKSVTCSIPGSPMVFVCDAAAIVAKPFGQQARDYQLMVMRKQGLQPCGACGGTGRILMPSTSAGTWMPSVGECSTCGGDGWTQIEKSPAATDQGQEYEKNETKTKCLRLMAETGSSRAECETALKTLVGDYEKALRWMDENRLKVMLGVERHDPECPGRFGDGTACAPSCPQAPF